MNRILDQTVPPFQEKRGELFFSVHSGKPYNSTWEAICPGTSGPVPPPSHESWTPHLWLLILTCQVTFSPPGSTDCFVVVWVFLFVFYKSQIEIFFARKTVILSNLRVWDYHSENILAYFCNTENRHAPQDPVSPLPSIRTAEMHALRHPVTHMGIFIIACS